MTHATRIDAPTVIYINTYMVWVDLGMALHGTHVPNRYLLISFVVTGTAAAAAAIATASIRGVYL